MICMKAYQNWMNAREDQLLHLSLVFTLDLHSLSLFDSKNQTLMLTHFEQYSKNQ